MKTGGGQKKKLIKKSKNHRYGIGDLILKKNRSPDRIDLKWKGPFTITQVLDENTVWIKEASKMTKQNIKNIIPYWK